MRSSSWLKDLIQIILDTRKTLNDLYKSLHTIWMKSGSNTQKWSISLNIQNCGGIKSAREN